MSADYGYIRLHRCIRDNSIVWEERASRLQAWIDLLMLANYKDGELVDGYAIKEVRRGSFFSSFPKLGARWNWDKRTVKRFLLFLQDNGMVKLEIFDGNGIAVNVVNYERYQGFSENDVPPNVPVDVPLVVPLHVPLDVPQDVPNEERIIKQKKVKESKKNNKPPISPFDELDKTDLSDKIKDCLREWFEYKKQKKEKSYQTEMGFKKFITQVKNAIQDHGEEKVISQFDYAMSREWSGAYLDKIKPDDKQQSFNMDEFLKRYEE